MNPGFLVNLTFANPVDNDSLRTRTTRSVSREYTFCTRIEYCVCSFIRALFFAGSYETITVITGRPLLNVHSFVSLRNS